MNRIWYVLSGQKRSDRLISFALLRYDKGVCVRRMVASVRRSAVSLNALGNAFRRAGVSVSAFNRRWADVAKACQPSMG